MLKWNRGPRVVTDESFLDISYDLWRSTVYGETAVSMLENDRRFAIIGPDYISRARLADLSRRRGYDRHELHGTLGKTFDIFTVASGVTKAKAIGSSHVETEFITRQELWAHLREHELPRHHRGNINWEITSAISEAVWHSVKPAYGEVIFEGFMPKPGSGHDFAQVAVASLVSMARAFPDGSPPNRALHGFVS